MTSVPKAVLRPSVSDLVIRLTDRANAEPAGLFPRDRPFAEQPGLYAWWADETALDALSAPFDRALPPLIYAGQAGATSARSGVERSATLHSRIRGNHLRGNLKSSTFRRTLAGILHTELGLELARPSVLTPDSNAALTAWIGSHLYLVIAPCEDRAILAEIEHDVLKVIDPPLNLMGMSATPVRQTLRALRADLASL